VGLVGLAGLAGRKVADLRRVSEPDRVYPTVRILWPPDLPDLPGLPDLPDLPDLCVLLWPP